MYKYLFGLYQINIAYNVLWQHIVYTAATPFITCVYNMLPNDMVSERNDTLFLLQGAVL